MNKPEKPKTDNLGWIRALLFPKKSKPLPPPVVETEPEWMPKPADTGAKTAGLPVGNPARVNTTVQTQDRPAAAPARHMETLPADKPPLTRLAPKKPSGPRKPLFEAGKVLPAFWTVASGLSFAVNIILIIALIIMARELLAIKAIVGDQLLGGLYENFILMDTAHIKTNITVTDNIPINFNLPISQDTVVTLTQNTPINGANVRINSGGLSINSAANIILPAGTNLPVHLEMTVPVNTTVPIQLNVPVDIPLQDTELHKPFIGLQQVVSPFYWLLHK